VRELEKEKEVLMERHKQVSILTLQTLQYINNDDLMSLTHNIINPLKHANILLCIYFISLYMSFFIMVTNFKRFILFNE